MGPTETSENFIYEVFQAKDFASVEDQEVIAFEDAGIPAEFESFSITMNLLLRKNEPKRKENINFFQTGHTHKKNLIMAITPQNTIKVTFRQGQEQEFLFSQTRIKPNVPYELCIVYEVVLEEDEILFYNAALYVNGKNETNFSLNSPITKPSGNIYFGSESAVATFVGELSHSYFVTRNLSEGEILSLHNEKKINPMDPKNPHAILEEAQQSQFPSQNLSSSQNKSVPATLQRTHVTLLQNHIAGQSQMVVLDNKSIRSMNKQHFEQAELNAIFARDSYLENQCRALSQHFKWMMCTLQKLSPAIEEPGKSLLPFNCLHHLIASGRINIKQQNFPIYIIEVRRLMQVLRYAEINVSEEQIMALANVTKTYVELRTDDPEFEDFQSQFRKNYGCVHMNLNRKSEEDRWQYRGIYYDRLLLAIRDSVLLPEEVYNIRAEYTKDIEKENNIVDEINMHDTASMSTLTHHNSNQTLHHPHGAQGKSSSTNILHQERLSPAEEEQEMRRRAELAEKLYDEKLKQLNCLPLSHFPPNSLLTYNSYNALLNLLEISKKDLSEAAQYTFRGIFLQRTYVGSNSDYPNILDLHRRLFQSIGSKGNVFSQLDIIYKNMCASGKEELDFDAFYAFWSKHVSGNDQKADVQTVFDDMQIHKTHILTIKDLYYYIQSYELVFLYQKQNTDSHIMIGVYNNQTDESIISSELPPNNSAGIKAISFITKKSQVVGTNEPQKTYILHSMKQTFRNEKGESIDQKAFDDFVLDPTMQYETTDLTYSPANPQPSYGIELKIAVTANSMPFNNHHLEYLVTSIKPIYKADADVLMSQVLEINSKHAAQIGPIKSPQPVEEEANHQDGQQEELASAGAEKEEEREYLPVPEPTWNQGKIIVNVNRCTHCEEHTTTTWHDEVDFIEKFNHFGDSLKSVFPNCEIVGNHDTPNAHYENFDVYIRGVGPEHERDDQGRIWLYSKKEGIFSFLYFFAGRILSAYDKLVLLSAGYGDTTEMEKVQEYFHSRFESMIPKKWAESHTYPCEVPKRKVEIQREIEEENSVKDGTRMICKNWGCGKAYDFSNDPISTKSACRFHPGSYQLGSIHALWPESWTCCRGEWTSTGCRRGPHRGIVEKKITYLCLNVGELNPKTKRPDSACGQQYSDESSSECLLHPGYFKRTKITSDEGEWTCCQDGNPNSAGCATLPAHKRAEWPDPEAKKYFVEKQIQNPGLISHDAASKKSAPAGFASETYKQGALRACVYRESLPYTPFVNSVKKAHEERKMNENEIRVCTRHGCKKGEGQGGKALIEFTDIDNDKAREKRKKNCFSHPGTFDFGHTGVTTVSQASTDTLWKPHWTCCRQEWDTVGCQLGYHDGPLRSDFVEGLVVKARSIYDEWKKVEEAQRLVKLQEDNINERYAKDENQKNAELGRLPMRHNEDTHAKASEIVTVYQGLLDQTKKNPRTIIDFYEHEYWPNLRAQKKFQKQISSLWKSKLEGYKAGSHDVKGLYMDENEVKKVWSVLFKKDDSISHGRVSGLCDKLHLHLFAVSDRLDYHFKFWDVVNRDLTWFTRSDMITKDQFIQWWFMDVDTYVEMKENYKEEQKKKTAK